MSKGYFITFEGADGCGKTTQVGLVEEELTKKGYNVLRTREPGGAKLGVKLREILLHYDGVVAPDCELFLYLADRAQHINTVIKPALEKGCIVLCDRHTDSTVAYQGYGRGIDLERINYLNNIAIAGLKPHLTVVFDVDSEVAQTRLGGEKDRLEALGLEFHKKVRQGYLEIAKQEPERVKVVDANKPVGEVFEEVAKLLAPVV